MPKTATDTKIDTAANSIADSKPAKGKGGKKGPQTKAHKDAIAAGREKGKDSREPVAKAINENPVYTNVTLWNKVNPLTLLAVQEAVNSAATAATARAVKALERKRTKANAKFDADIAKLSGTVSE